MNPSAQSRRTQPACPSAALSDAIADELRRYDDHLHDVRGLAASTRRNHCRIVGLLLQKKFAGGVIDMARLHAADVRRFIARQLETAPRILPLRKSQPPCEVTSAIGRSAATRLPV